MLTESLIAPSRLRGGCSVIYGAYSSMTGAGASATAGSWCSSGCGSMTAGGCAGALSWTTGAAYAGGS